MDVDFKGNQLLLDGHFIDFPGSIKSIKIFKDLVLVMLTVPKGIINNQNVYAVSVNNKKVIWRIQEPDLIYDNSPYMNFYDAADAIIVGNWNGIAYTINEYDGTRIQGVQTK